MINNCVTAQGILVNGNLFKIITKKFFLLEIKTKNQNLCPNNKLQLRNVIKVNYGVGLGRFTNFINILSAKILGEALSKCYTAHLTVTLFLTWIFSFSIPDVKALELLSSSLGKPSKLIFGKSLVFISIEYLLKPQSCTTRCNEITCDSLDQNTYHY